MATSTHINIIQIVCTGDPRQFTHAYSRIFDEIGNKILLKTVFLFPFHFQNVRSCLGLILASLNFIFCCGIRTSLTSIIAGVFFHPVLIAHWRVRGPNPTFKFFQTHPNIFMFLLFFLKKFFDLFLFFFCVDFHKNTIILAAKLQTYGFIKKIMNNQQFVYESFSTLAFSLFIIIVLVYIKNLD